MFPPFGDVPALTVPLVT